MNSFNKNKVSPLFNFPPEDPNSENQQHKSRFESFDSNERPDG